MNAEIALIPKLSRSRVVCVSLVELIQGGAGGLSVLRTFRLLRILKLVRFLPALQYQLKVMLRTLDNVPTFLALLVLFIFIFRFRCFYGDGADNTVEENSGVFSRIRTRWFAVSKGQ